MAKYGGWAGKVLHVDLSTGRTWTDDTVEKYKEYLGGTGIGYKVIWDEVPAGTKPYDPVNRIIFAVGPLAGTGAPCNGRTAITTLWPTCWPQPLVATGHMGGQFAAKLKYAGYDAVVIEGRADRPVWLSIVDQQVEIQDARRLWGQGIRRTTEAIAQIMGTDGVVAAIGQAGENLVPMSVVMNSVSHSAGGIGSVMGSKNLKAIGVRGTGSVRIAGNKDEWEKLIKYHLSLLGANNQHVVPSSPQPWAEFYEPRSRWVGSKGRTWGAALRPIETGTCEPHNLNRIAYRTNNAAFFNGDIAWQYTVRGNGCTSCPIRCHTMIKVPSVSAKYGIPEVGQNTCAGLNFGRACLGPGSQNRANLAIGRAIRLILMNIGGAYAGIADMDTIGAAHKISMVVAENEQESPWSPYHVDKGFKREESTVTVLSVVGQTEIADLASNTPEGFLYTITHTITGIGNGSGMFYSPYDLNLTPTEYGHEPVLLLPPSAAQTFGKKGWTKDTIREYLYQHARVPKGVWAGHSWFKNHPNMLAPKWREAPSDTGIPIVFHPKAFQVIVVGGPANKMSYCAPGGRNAAVTRSADKWR